MQQQLRTTAQAVDGCRVFKDEHPLVERLNDHLKVGRLHVINPETVAELRALAVQTADALVGKHATLSEKITKDLAAGPGTVRGLLHLLGAGRHALIATSEPHNPAAPDFGPRRPPVRILESVGMWGARPSQGGRWLRRYGAGVAQG